MTWNWRLVAFMLAAVVVGGIGIIIATSSRRSATSVVPTLLLDNASAATLIGSQLFAYQAASLSFVEADVTTGAVARTTPVTLPAGSSVSWSPSGTKAAIFRLGQTPAAAVIDLGTGAQTLLKPNIDLPTWNYDGTRMLYQFTRTDPVRTSLVTADPDGSNFVEIMDLPHPFDSLWWGPSAPYAIALDSTQSPPTYVRILISSKKIEPLATGYGTVRFSPSGSLVLLDRSEDVLGIANLETGAVKDIPIDSSATHCAWQSDNDLLCVTGTAGNLSLSAVAAGNGTVHKQADFSQDISVDELLGINGQTIVFQDGSSVLSLPVNK